MKGLIMLHKIKNILLHNNNRQVTIKLGTDSGIDFVSKIKNLFDFSPKYARQEIRIDQKRKF